jgi:tetratricopeptide (TPR) repeat protein
MKASLDILRGELERLFSAAALKELCADYFGIDPAAEGLVDEAKAVFVRRLVDWCASRHAVEALAEAMLVAKKGMVDPRVRQVFGARFERGLPEGETAGGFRVGAMLSQDGIRAVHACQKADGGESGELVMEIVNGEVSADAAAVQRYLMMVRILRTIESNAVQKMVALGVLPDGRPFIVREKIEGSQVSAVAPISVVRAVAVAEAVVDALEALHAQGIHCPDLRAENVLFRSAGENEIHVVLGGLGTDRLFPVVEPDGKAGVVWPYGVARAMAPELARGASADFATDAYALGCLLYEMVTGQPVFIGRTAADVLAAHMAKAPAQPSAAVDAVVPGAFDVLVQKLLAKEPSGRPRSMDDIRKGLVAAKRAAEEMEAMAAQTGTRDDIAAWADALLENPEDSDALDGLKSEAKRCNAWGAAVEVLEEVALMVDDASVIRHVLMEAASAATRYTKNYDKARQIYTQLFESNPHDPVLAEAMIELLRAEGNYEEVVQKLVASAEKAETQAEKMGIVREIARTYDEEMKDFPKAFDYYAACLQATDADKEILVFLDKLASRTSRYQDLAAIYTQAAQTAEASQHVEVAAMYYQRLGDLYHGRLDQASYALTCFQKVLEVRPSDMVALDAVADLYRGAQQWTELAQVIARIGEAEQVPSRGRDRLAEAARIQWEKLSDKKAAHDLLQKVLADDPAHAEASDLMVKILEAAKEWGKLAALLSTRVEAIPAGAEHAAARFKLGELFELRLSDVASAQKQYEKAIEDDPKHLDAIKGLERIYARVANLPALLKNLEMQLEIAVTPRQRVLLLERIAEICEEEFKDTEKAIASLQAIMEIDATHASSLIALTRHFRKAKRFEDLVGVLEKRAALAATPEDKRDLLTERAETIRNDIGDAKRAAEAFQAVAALGGGGALDALAQSQLDAGNFADALKTFEKMLAEATTPAVKVDVLSRIANLHYEKNKDLTETVATLRRARDIAPQNQALIASLTAVYLEQGNYSSAVDLLAEQLETVDGRHARADIFAKMGLISLENIGDSDKAVGYFEHALELDEANILAGDKVSTLYRKRGEWAKAIPIYERHAASADVLKPDKRLELFTQMGEAYVQLGRREEALKCFRRAADVAAEPKLMKRLGEVALELKEFGLAKEQLQRYQDAAGDSLSLEEKVDLFVKHGRASFGADDVNEAAKLARQATIMAPENAEARLLLADVHEARGDFRSAVEAKQRVLSTLDKDDPRWRVLVRSTATVQFEKLRDAEGAANLLKGALEAHPEDRDILGDLLKIYYATKRYGEVVEIVLKIAGLVDDAQQKARYYLTVAKICRRELKDLDGALKYFEMAIEKDPALEDAEKALVEVLTEKMDWDSLERYYKRQIGRLAKDAPAAEKLALFAPLADLVINKLDRVKDGIMLTEAIAKLEPSNLAWSEKLADLYGWGKEHAAKSVPLHARLLEANPARVDSFRMLYRIHSGDENPDEAWCAVSILALLNQASPEERKFYKDCQPADVPTPQSRLKEEHWKKLLLHGELDQNISAIFAVISEPIFRQKARAAQEFGLNADGAIDVRKDKSPFAQFVNFASGTLSLEPPQLFFHDGQGSGFQLVDTRPPVMVAGQTASSLKDRLGLAFTLGQQLTLLNPGLYVRKLISSGTELSAWLLASIKIFVQGLPVPSELAGAVQERLQPLRDGLDNAQLERLQGYVQAFVAKSGGVNLKQWARSIDFTCDRAGLLLCGDVSVAVRILKEQISDKAVLAERLRAITLFTVSDEHHRLREQIGTALKFG